MEVFDPAETAAASFEDETSDVEPRPWIVEIYFGRGVDEARIRALIADTMGEELAATVVTEEIAQQDWVQRSLTRAGARAGRDGFSFTDATTGTRSGRTISPWRSRPPWPSAPATTGRRAAAFSPSMPC